MYRDREKYNSYMRNYMKNRRKQKEEVLTIDKAELLQFLQELRERINSIKLMCERELKGLTLNLDAPDASVL